MSKAFTRESDDAPERPAAVRTRSVLPPGAKNYLTAGGADRLRRELEEMIHRLRPAAAALEDADERRRQLLNLDQRMVRLEQILATAVIVSSPAENDSQVRFGATVVVRDKSGSESSYRIVGVDETDLDRGWVSWCSPIARALLNVPSGQRVKFRFPSGEEELEIIRVTYEP